MLAIMFVAIGYIVRLVDVGQASAQVCIQIT